MNSNTYSDIAELVSYEQMKLHARRLRPAPLDDWPLINLNLHAHTLVMRRCDYLAAPSRYDLRALRSEGRLASIMMTTTSAASVPGKSTSTPEERSVRELHRYAKWPKVADAMTEAELAAINESMGNSWTIFAKIVGDNIATIEMGAIAKEILEAADRPRFVTDLIAIVLPSTGMEEVPEFQAGFLLIQQLIKRGLLMEVKQL